LQTLDHTDWNKSRAAELLGIERSTIDRKIKAYDLKK
jgi:Nif-specific regulatory protein